MKFWKLAVTTTVLITSTSANAALIERLGGLAYYDTEADLTWLADANYAKTSGYDTDGFMTWAGATTWAAGLNVGGVEGWRLADTLQPDASCDTQYGSVSYGYNCAGSEMGNLFYNVLGNLTGAFENAGPFSNIQAYDHYWSSTEYEYDTESAWYFLFHNGYQMVDDKNHQMTVAWAVQSGDVSAVPVPAAVWLFGSGLIGLVGFARRKKF